MRTRVIHARTIHEWVHSKTWKQQKGRSILQVITMCLEGTDYNNIKNRVNVNLLQRHPDIQANNNDGIIIIVSVYRFKCDSILWKCRPTSDHLRTGRVEEGQQYTSSSLKVKVCFGESPMTTELVGFDHLRPGWEKGEEERGKGGMGGREEEGQK